MSANSSSSLHLWSLGFLLAFLAFLIVLGGRSVFDYPAAAPAEIEFPRPVLIGEMDGLTTSGSPEILDVSSGLLPAVRDETPGLPPEEPDWRDDSDLGYLAPFYPPPR